VLDQGPASFHGTIGEWAPIAEAFGLRASDVLRALPLEVVSTGLRYLIVPVTSEGLQRARIRSDVSGLMAAHGAQFGVLLDPAKLEVRHWNNDGVIEDVATGSAAGTIAAYLVKHAVLTRGSRVDLSQGRFAGRPSRITIWVDPDGTVEEGHVHVAGNAAMAGHGALVTTCPAPLAA
jgi:PhzF family phenazine biosynthesis protein